MQTVTTIGLDIAKSVFQVHGVDAAGQVLIRRQLKRRTVLAFFEKLPPCLVGIEACASSHHWSRELQALGHTVRLMPPAYVKPYVKRHKNDATDAEAICEAVTRANMRFVATKMPEQQSCLTLHRTRHLLIRRQTSVINAIRAHLAEFGIVAPIGRMVSSYAGENPYELIPSPWGEMERWRADALATGELSALTALTEQVRNDAAGIAARQDAREAELNARADAISARELQHAVSVTQFVDFVGKASVLFDKLEQTRADAGEVALASPPGAEPEPSLELETTPSLAQLPASLPRPLIRWNFPPASYPHPR